MTGGSDAAAVGIAPPGYRLPAETRLGRVQLQVASLDRSLAFYEGLLGLRVLERSAERAALGAHGEGGAVLVELHARAGARAAPRRGRLGLYHFAILLPDRGALGRFLVHLAACGAYAGMSDHAVSEALYLTDPDGLGVEVYADRPREAWRPGAGGELHMVTEPLDGAALVRAAGGAPWTGMPVGTAVGHVHLHVGDIERGAAFYHAALGFDKMVWSYPGALFLAAGGYHHHLGTNTWAAGATPAAEDDARLLSWEVVVPTAGDVRAAAASLERAGCGAVRDPADGAAEARDPWGTAVRVVAERR